MRKLPTTERYIALKHRGKSANKTEGNVSERKFSLDVMKWVCFSKGIER